MSRTLSAFSLVLLFVLSSVTTLQAQTPAASDNTMFQGKVTDTRGDPVPGANVILVNTSYGSWSDGNGDYAFAVPASHGGEVSLRVMALGYASQSRTLPLTPGTLTQDFQLEIDPLVLPPVVVSAQKREEDLQRVPISISAIDARVIRQRGAQRMLDLEHAVPNLNFDGPVGDDFTAVTIRGIGDFSRNIGYENRAGVYIDGAYAGRSLAVNQDLLDLERVEVLRGPQGTLFGMNTVSGAINFITRKPHGAFQGKYAVEVGNYDYASTMVMLNVPLLQNRLFAKIAAKHMNRDGFIRNLFNGNDLNGMNAYAGRLQLRYLASEDLELNLSLHGIRDRTPHAANALAVAGPAFDLSPDPRQVNHDADEFTRRDLFSSALSLDYARPNGHAIQSLSTYHASETANRREEDYSNVFDAFSEFDEKNRHFTQELRLTSPLDRPFDFVTGLYYFYQNVSTNRGVMTGPTFFVPGYQVTTPGDVSTNSIAGYFHGNWHVMDKLTLTGGLRYTHEFKTIDYSIRNMPSVPFTIDLDHFTDDYNEGALSPKGGINVQVSDDLLLYGSVARGFKSGGWHADFLESIEHIRFDPEFVTSYEVGFKLTTLDHRLRLNTAAYLAKFDDYQVFQFLRTSQGQTILSLTNAGKVTSKGGEVEVSALPADGLAITAGLGLSNAKFDEFRDGGGEGIHYDGNKLENAPEFEYSIAVDYRQRLGHAGDIVLHGDFAHRDEFFTNPNNDRQDYFIEAYDLLNARAGYETADGNWGLFLKIQNVTDELYASYRDLAFLGVPRAWFGLPRTYSLQLTYQFSK